MVETPNLPPSDLSLSLPETWSFKRFLLLYALYFVAGNLILLLPPVKTWFVAPWTELNTHWAATLAGLFGSGFQAVETMVYTGGLTLSVKPGCNGVHALVLCLGAILAFPATWASRALGVLMATFGIFGLNIVRLVNLFYIAQRFPDRLELFHVYIWQTLIALLAFGVFLLWGTFVASTPAAAETRDGG